MGKKITLTDLQTEAMHVASLSDDEQYIGGQTLAKMVLKYVSDVDRQKAFSTD